MSERELFMLRAEIDQLSIMRFARHSGLPLQRVDGGYIVHALLRALFDSAAPRPFLLRDDHRRLVLFAYCHTDHRQLAERARALADPLALAALNLESLCSKSMPTEWRAGATYHFETRICPIVRTNLRLADKSSREADAFLQRCWREGKDVSVDREEVYRDWLERELARSGAARLVETRIMRFQRIRLFRRDHGNDGRRATRCERPDATMGGVLKVTDPVGFTALLRRGLGRHRAFGFGMLLLSH